MPKFSKASLAKLDTCHPDIKKVMLEVIKELDIAVNFGHRTAAEQLVLFKKGRVFNNGRWVKTGKTVTDKDGTIRKSKHNYLPSLAIDIYPFPLDWNNLDRFHHQKDVVMKCANRLGVELVWGADWDGDGNIAEHTLQDYPHFELKA